MKLFLDDIRDPPDETWVVARSYADAVLLVGQHGYPSEVSFDHDLGEPLSGMDFARFLVELDLDAQERRRMCPEDTSLDSRAMPDNFSFKVHSANPPGAENIEALMGRYVRFRQGH